MRPLECNYNFETKVLPDMSELRYYLYNYRVSDEWLGEYLALVQPRLGACMPFDLVSMAHR